LFEIIVQVKIVRRFIYSSAVLLFLTAAAKVTSVFGSAALLGRHEPLMGLNYRSLLGIAGLLELAVSAVCVLNKSITIRLWMIAWLATIILVYRVSMPWVGYQQPCPCLGSLTDVLHVSPHVANDAMKGALAYLLAGSYGSLLWLWLWQRHKIQA
jgi:hypothetical protein